MIQKGGELPKKKIKFVNTAQNTEIKAKIRFAKPPLTQRSKLTTEKKNRYMTQVFGSKSPLQSSSQN